MSTHTHTATPSVARELLQQAEETLQFYTTRNAELIAQKAHLVAALELCLFAVTNDADTNNGKVDCLAVAETIRSALGSTSSEH